MEITRSIVSERDRALLGGDYANYHAQTTRKIQTLRKRLGTATPRGRKYTPKSAVTSDNVSQNSQWVQLLLASSERAWADAMTMKSNQSPENTQRPMAGSTKKQIVSRFRRAISYAINLVEILSDTAHASTQTDLLEARAYLALLKGGLDFEKARWISCIQNYAVARVIYVALDTSTKTDIYSDLLSNTVDPSIKYAAYQSKLPRTKAVGDIAIEHFPDSEVSTKTEVEKSYPDAFVTTADKIASAQSDAPSNLPTSITWRARKVKIEDASVSQALGVSYEREITLGSAFQEFSKGNTDTRPLASAYEEVINARQEVVDVTKAAIDELRAQGVDQGDSRIQSLQVTRTAVNYAVIEWRIGRNRILCGKDDGVIFESEPAKHNLKPRKDGKHRTIKEEGSGRKLARLREHVALYDSILQSLDAIKELPGVVADTELVIEVDQKKAYFNALKCLTIGRSQALHNNITNALALFSRANDLVVKSRPSPSSSTKSENQPPKLDITPVQQKALLQYVSSLTMQYRALAELNGLEALPKTSESTSAIPLIERFHLNKYDSNLDPKKLVNYPPSLQPIPVKPLFFDLAWNYIQYPGRKETAVQSVTAETPEVKKEEKPAKRGWFGFGR